MSVIIDHCKKVTQQYHKQLWLMILMGCLSMLVGSCSIAPAHPQQPLGLYQGSVTELGQTFWNSKVVPVGCEAGDSQGDREDCKEEGIEAVMEKDPPAMVIHRMCQELSSDPALSCYQQAATLGRVSVLIEFVSTCENIRKDRDDIIDCIERAF